MSSSNYLESAHKQREEMKKLLVDDEKDSGDLGNEFNVMATVIGRNEKGIQKSMLADARVSNLILGRLLLVEQAVMAFCLMSFGLGTTVVTISFSTHFLTNPEKNFL